MNDTDSIDGFFIRDGAFVRGTDAARGPWAADACHAGPATAVIAGAIEAAEPSRQLTRLTVTYRRPAPMTGFRVDVEGEGGGRAAASVSARLVDGDGRLCATASGLLLTPETLPELPTATLAAPDFADARVGSFPIRAVPHGRPFFGHAVEVRLPAGEDGAPGPGTLWMRTPPIVAGEPMSPFQSVCPLADCANGFSRNADIRDLSFINPDLTVLLHRLPDSDWIASRGYSFWESSGIGATQATLFDTRGVIGSALQSLVLRPH